jgi:hypothetical protein
MNKRCSNPVPPEIQAEVDALAGLLEEQIDTDGIPEVGGWDDGKRGVFYRPFTIISRMRVIRLVLTGLCGNMFHSICLKALIQSPMCRDSNQVFWIF